MSTPHVTESLLRFHLGASDDAEHLDIDAHLMGCTDCLGSYLELKRTFDFASASEERPVPAVRERLRSQVRAQVAAPPERHFLPRWDFRWLTMGAAVAAAALALLLWTHRSPTEPAENPRLETLIDTGSDTRIAQVF